MKIEINFINELDIDLSSFYPLAHKLIEYADNYLLLDENDHEEISYIFISDDKMHELNKTYRNIDKTTDVLTFDSDEDGYLADVFISYAEALRQTKEFNHSLEIEIAYLFIHGFLHSIGYDHGEHDVECLMFDIQDKIVEEICKKNN